MNDAAPSNPAASSPTVVSRPIVPHGTSLRPPRPGVRHVPVPRIGIVIADDQLRQRIDRAFHWPMILLALAVLPLLIVEFLHRPQGALDIAVRIGFAVIWLAFVIEFIIKVAIAESRVEYVRRNWLDVVIIILPLFRPLRLARTARLFRLRGVGTKFVRYVLTFLLGMDATERMLRRIGLKTNDERVHPDQMTRAELVSELSMLRERIDEWEAWYQMLEVHTTVAEVTTVSDADQMREPDVRDAHPSPTIEAHASHGSATQSDRR